MFDGLGQPGTQGFASNHPVDHDFDVVTHLPVEFQVFRQLHDLAVDACANEALFQQVVEEVAVLALLTLDNRCENLELRPVFVPGNRVDNLLDRLRRDWLPALIATLRADPGKEHSQIIINLRDRADGAARVASAGLLLDRNRRSQPGDRVNFRLGYLSQKLPRVAGQRFDVPPLPLGVKRVKRQRTLPRSADPGHHDQLVLRQLQRNIAQVMLPRTADNDLLRLGTGFGFARSLRRCLRSFAVCCSCCCRFLRCCRAGSASSHELVYR